jgi:hypothetical protein
MLVLLIWLFLSSPVMAQIPVAEPTAIPTMGVPHYRRAPVPSVVPFKTPVPTPMPTPAK